MPIIIDNSEYEEEKVGFSSSISYLVALIIQISKYVTKGRGLSKNGVNALLLFLLTAGLLYANTEMPKTLTGVLKLYWIPIIFLSYSVVDLLKNIEKINKFFRRLGQRTEFTYQNIRDGNIGYDDLEYNLSYLYFSYEQIANIIKKLIDTGQFTPEVQNNLLNNSAIYRIDTLPLIRDSFINPISINTTIERDEPEKGERVTPISINWTSTAVCIFLSKMRKDLPKEYLDKLIDKYREYPSVLIAIGHYYHYKKGDNEYFKIGNEFKYTGNRTRISAVLFVSMALIFLIFAVFIATLPINVKQNYNFYSLGVVALFFISFLVYIHVANNDFLWSLKNHLKNYDVTKDDFVVSEIINDMVESF